MFGYLKTGKLGATSDKTGVSDVSSKQAKKGPTVPWVEKYRPRTVDDVVEQSDVIQVLRECLAGSDLPHLLFYGPPGTGKTSAILAMARQLFGDITKDRVLELNASDERGIQIVRDKIKAFSQLTASGTRPDGRPCPPYKLVILDEADSMTKDAQAALRRTMEKETRSTRFCLICNYVSRIIPPLTSRCSKFRFKPLAEDMVTERLKYICDRENLVYDDDALTTVVKSCGGDLRRAITCLHSCARLGGTVNNTSIAEVTGLIPPDIVTEFLGIREYSNLIDVYVTRIITEAYSVSQLIDQLTEVVVHSPTLTNQQKARICEKLAVCSYRLVEGGSEMMQLLEIGCTIMLANVS